MELFKKVEKDPLEIIKEKYEAYNADLAMTTQAVDEAENKVADAKAALENAADQNDATAFSSAKKQLADAETALEMATMRKTRLIEKGPAPKSEIIAAISYYEQKISTINCKACKELLDGLTALNNAIDAANSEAGQIYRKEKELCRLTGTALNHSNLEVLGNYIYAKSFMNNVPSNSQLAQKSDLKRFAAKA